MGRKLTEPLLSILAANVEKLKGTDAQAAIVKRGRIGTGSASRVLRGQNVRLETLARIARGFGVEAWQLLVVDFDPLHPPQLLTPELEEELDALRDFQVAVLAEAARRARKPDDRRDPPGANPGFVDPGVRKSSKSRS
jgi:hypothetical protein